MVGVAVFTLTCLMAVVFGLWIGYHLCRLWWHVVVNWRDYFYIDPEVARQIRQEIKNPEPKGFARVVAVVVTIALYGLLLVGAAYAIYYLSLLYLIGIVVMSVFFFGLFNFGSR